jgi:outer membrane protein OmpA-like peptidoglycan-associated protein
MKQAKDKTMSVRGRFLYTMIMAVAMCSAPAWAVFNTNGERGAVRTLSAETMGAAKLNVGTGISIFQAASYVKDIYDPAGQQLSFQNAVRDPARMLSSNIFLGAGFAQFWDIAMALPLYYDWMGFGNFQDGGIGDLEISSKFLYPNFSKRLFYQSYFVSATVPVGMKSNGFFPRHPYFIEGNDTNPASTFYSSEYATVKVLLLWTFDIGNVVPSVPLQVHFNIGGVITSSFLHQRNTAIGSLALEYAPSQLISLFLDFHGESRWSNFSTTIDPTSDPLLLSPGVRLTTSSGLYIGFVGDISLSSKAKSTRRNWHPVTGPAKGYRYSTGVIPDYGIQFIVGWNGNVVRPDDDKDGIPNDVDKCPKAKEDFDGFRDEDGCPDYDNDGDGVPDSLDKCPDKAEDKDGYKDNDGCPDFDNDNDGIPDTRDQCPNQPEDFDGAQDQDGCPDFDNDNDGIPDSIDKCPNEPEDIDEFQDKDGCPDVDNDQDGVPDVKDNCPGIAGTPQNNGCPPDTLKPRREVDFPKSQVLYGINFRKGTVELTFESYQFLEPIIQKLRSYPEVEIEIHGHTDSMGNYTKNMQVSQMRAEAVRQYLIAKGIASERVRAVGFGSSSPIADNKSAAGRSQNRRVEMVRVK